MALQHWGLNEPALILVGNNRNEDTLDMEVVGLDERSAISVSKLSLVDNAPTLNTIKVGDYHIRMEIVLKTGTRLDKRGYG